MLHPATTSTVISKNRLILTLEHSAPLHVSLLRLSTLHESALKREGAISYGNSLFWLSLQPHLHAGMETPFSSA